MAQNSVVWSKKLTSCSLSALAIWSAPSNWASRLGVAVAADHKVVAMAGAVGRAICTEFKLNCHQALAHLPCSIQV